MTEPTKLDDDFVVPASGANRRGQDDDKLVHVGQRELHRVGLPDNNEIDARVVAGIAEELFGGKAQVWDCQGRQKAPDVRLDFDDERVGMLEHTRCVSSASMALESAIGRSEWSFDGRFNWIVTVRTAEACDRFRVSYQKTLHACENAGLTSVRRAAELDMISDTVLLRAIAEGDLVATSWSSSSDSADNSYLLVQPPGHSVAMAADWSTLNEMLAAAFATPLISEHVEKLRAAPETDWRCLMIEFDLEAFDQGIAAKLTYDDETPVDPPPLPEGIDALVLMPVWSRQVTYWSDNRWTTRIIDYPVVEI